MLGTRGEGPVVLVVLDGRCLRQGHRVAHRLPPRLPGPGTKGTYRRHRPTGVGGRADQRPRSRRRGLRGYRGSMSDLTLLHNPKCSTSRAALETIEGEGVEADVVQYLKEPLDEAALRELIGKLEDEPTALVCRDSFFK